jgi:hypothetical protein
MQQREKSLAIGLACAGGIYALYLFIGPTFIEPWNERQALLKLRGEELEQKEFEELALLKSTSRLKNYRDRSLPPNSQVAHSLYQEWLDDIALICGLSDVRMTLGQRIATRDGIFVTVPVSIDAQGTTDQIVRFLEQMESIDLLHRVSNLDLISKGNDGNPEVVLKLTAEGLSMVDAPQRARLFPQTELVEPCDASKTQIKVASSKEFSVKLPFRIRIGTEFLEVTAINGDEWTVERGVAQSAAATHKAETQVELFPVRSVPAGSPTPSEVAKKLVATSFFAKPTPPVSYKPRFAAIPVQRATRGKPFSYQLKVESWNPSHGKPIFELKDEVPKGMTIEASTGTIRWTPADDAELGSLAIVAVATSPTGLAKPVEGGFTLDVKNPNHTPRIKPVPPTTVYLGRRLTLQIQAEDSDLPNDRLSYAFEGTSPPGARIDQRDGKIDWTAPPETELGTQTFTLKVSDNGDPPASSTIPLTIKFEDDAAAYTFLVGCLAEGEGKGEAMLHDRTTNQILRLHPGDIIKRADLEAVILDVQPREITYASGTEIFKLGFGNQMRESQKVTLPPLVAPMTPPTSVPTAPTATEPTVPPEIPVPKQES